MSTITGKLVGSDGQPTPLAHVHLAGATHSPVLLSLLDDPVLITEVVQKDGTFRISTRETGPFVLLCTAVGHEQLRLPLPLEGQTDLSVDIQLTRVVPDTSQSEMSIFTTIDGGATHQRAYLAKQADGTFRVDLPTMGDSITYQIPAVGTGPWGTSLIGATTQRYELTTAHDYSSVVPVTNGHVIIKYRVPSQNAVASRSTTIHDSTSVIAAFTTRQETFAQYVTASACSLQNHLRSGKSFSSFTYPWVELADTLARVAGLIREGLLKDEMALEVLECYHRAHIPFTDRRLRELVAGVSPTSLAWVYHGTLGLATQRIPEMGDTYFASLVDHHPWRSYAAYLLFYQCAAAEQAHDDSAVRTILTRLTKDFKNTPGAREALKMYAPRDVIQIGSALPDFAFPSLDDSTEVFTNATFRGHHLLVVFWGTYCSPCVAEMPVLHRIYEKYGKAGLKMLSVSLGNEPEQVSRFRKLRWPMPWSVTAVPEDRVSPIMIRFATATPRHILVDPKGMVLMIDSLLYGSQLDSTLAHLLAENEQQAP